MHRDGYSGVGVRADKRMVKDYHVQGGRWNVRSAANLDPGSLELADKLSETIGRLLKDAEYGVSEVEKAHGSWLLGSWEIRNETFFYSERLNRLPITSLSPITGPSPITGFSPIHHLTINH